MAGLVQTHASPSAAARRRLANRIDGLDHGGGTSFEPPTVGKVYRVKLRSEHYNSKPGGYLDAHYSEKSDPWHSNGGAYVMVHDPDPVEGKDELAGNWLMEPVAPHEGGGAERARDVPSSCCFRLRSETGHFGCRTGMYLFGALSDNEDLIRNDESAWVFVDSFENGCREVMSSSVWTLEPVDGQQGLDGKWRLRLVFTENAGLTAAAVSAVEGEDDVGFYLESHRSIVGKGSNRRDMRTPFSSFICVHRCTTTLRYPRGCSSSNNGGSGCSNNNGEAPPSPTNLRENSGTRRRKIRSLSPHHRQRSAVPAPTLDECAGEWSFEEVIVGPDDVTQKKQELVCDAGKVLLRGSIALDDNGTEITAASTKLDNRQKEKHEPNKIRGLLRGMGRSSNNSSSSLPPPPLPLPPLSPVLAMLGRTYRLRLVSSHWGSVQGRYLDAHRSEAKDELKLQRSFKSQGFAGIVYNHHHHDQGQGPNRSCGNSGPQVLGAGRVLVHSVEENEKAVLSSAPSATLNKSPPLPPSSSSLCGHWRLEALTMEDQDMMPVKSGIGGEELVCFRMALVTSHYGAPKGTDYLCGWPPDAFTRTKLRRHLNTKKRGGGHVMMSGRNVQAEVKSPLYKLQLSKSPAAESAVGLAEQQEEGGEEEYSGVRKQLQRTSLSSSSSWAMIAPLSLCDFVGASSIWTLERVTTTMIHTDATSDASSGSSGGGTWRLRLVTERREEEEEEAWSSSPSDLSQGGLLMGGSKEGVGSSAFSFLESHCSEKGDTRNKWSSFVCVHQEDPEDGNCVGEWAFEEVMPTPLKLSIKVKKAKRAIVVSAGITLLRDHVVGNDGVDHVDETFYGSGEAITSGGQQKEEKRRQHRSLQSPHSLRDDQKSIQHEERNQEAGEYVGRRVKKLPQRRRQAQQQHAPTTPSPPSPEKLAKTKELLALRNEQLNAKAEGELALKKAELVEQQRCLAEEVKLIEGSAWQRRCEL